MIGAIGAAALSLGALTASAQAEDRQFGYSITLAGVSDYMFRGISTNAEQPAFQPFIEFTYGIFYLDFWGSNVPDPYGPWEQDIYIGFRPVTGPISWDIAAWYYFYPGGDLAGVDGGDYWEFRIGATVTPVENVSLGAAVYYTPDQDLAYVETYSIEGTLSYTLPQIGIFTPTIGGLIGYSSTTEDQGGFFAATDDSYTYWNAGVKLAVDKFFMDFRYWDTTIDSGLADERVVFTAGVNLP
jgi:uncharacterized protein (TIGR02001 family)